MPLPEFTKELDRLVTKFTRNQAFYTSKEFQESELRVEFTSPLFEALGWDVSNRAGNPPHLREVVVETRVEEKGHRRKADYTFQVSGQPRLVVETKKPSEDLEDPKHILQLKKYAWNLSVRFAVLTNFCQTKIYAVPAPPVITHPNEFLLEQVEFLQYLAKPDLLYGLLSKERVIQGALDQYFETIPKHKRDKAYQRSLFRLRGSRMVDDHFLDDLMAFRRDLARAIVQRNPKADLNESEVNEAVQRIIDRIVFLRIGEDRGIVYPDTLLDLAEKWGSQGSRAPFYPRLVEHFASFNKPYNGLLFKRHPLSEDLDLSDEVLAGFIEKISVETSPYRFDVIPVEILGSIYERFLGSVVKVFPSGRTTVDEKPEVRKAGGVYYTPKYIVDYIVSQTVGKLLEGRTPEQVALLRVLDPACGSGSFLLGAFTRIMDYLAEWFHGHPKSNGKYKDWYDREEDGTVRLTPYAKRHILLNNIYGVDIDPQACEVTQLSLYLKLLEGESGDTLRAHHEKGGAEAFLPDLRNNVKCGNSLVGTEFEDGKLVSVLDEKERKRINPFDWEAEFPKIMKAGGFDGVIGNPPWGADFTDHELEYHRIKNHEIIVRMIDSFMYFVYQGSKRLNARGCFGMILPDVFLYQQDNERLRSYILRNFKINVLLNLGDVFKKVTRPASVVALERGSPSRHVARVADISGIPKPEKPVAILDPSKYNSVPQSEYLKMPGFPFVTRDLHRYTIWTKVKGVSHKVLQELVDRDGIQRGVSPDLKEAFVIDKATAQRYHLEKVKLRKVLTGGKQVKRYFIETSDLMLIYTVHDDNFKELPNIRVFIDGFKNEITCREVKEHKHSIYSLHRPRSESIFLKDKKVLGVITEDEIVVALDEEKYFTTDGLFLFGVQDNINIKYLMGILNSKLFVLLYRLLAQEEGRVLSQVKPTTIGQLPIRCINFSNRTDKARHDKIVKLVERMMELHKQLAKAKSDNDKTLLQRQISSTDRQINSLVYVLYGLTSGDIKLAEGSIQNQ